MVMVNKLTTYILSEARYKDFLDCNFEKEIASYAYKAFLLSDAITHAEELVDVMEDIAFTIDPNSDHESEDDDISVDDIDEDDREWTRKDYAYFRYWIQAVEKVLPRKDSSSAAYFSLDIICKKENERRLWRGPDWSKVLVSAADKILAIQNTSSHAFDEYLSLSSSSAQGKGNTGVTVINDFLEAELKYLNVQLREAKKPSSGSAEVAHEIAHAAMQRALSIALSEWADPNQRCAAITIALAMLVSPKEVSLCKPPRVQATKATEIEARYKGVEVFLPKVSTVPPNSFFIDRTSGTPFARPASRFARLENLAVTYGDSENNKECLAHLRTYFDPSSNSACQAAVLGIAWLILQRRSREISRLLATGGNDSGYTMKCDSLDFGFRTNLKKVDEAWFQGLHYPPLTA